MAVVNVWGCDRCGAERVAPGEPVDAPTCVEVSEETNEFPDGSFVYIRTGSSHGPMVLRGVREDNPLADVVAEQAPVEADPED